MSDTILDCKVLQFPLGQIRGALRKAIYDDLYYSFEGIPYGQPPVGELRFRSPRPAFPWTGVKDCLAAQPIPVQIDYETNEVIGSEDCLNLNVYVKRDVNSCKPLPVLVFIYGGGFYMGQATRRFYSPDYFMAEDIIVVTVNFRVCCLGFLSINDPQLQIPGNAGLKDIVLALKWVQQYISHFKGNPDNVTLYGFSSGAACVHYIMAMESAKGLFHKAICMGGSILSPWSCVPQKDNAYQLALGHGYKGENSDRQVLEFLRSLRAEVLIMHKLTGYEDKLNGRCSSFAPCVEPYQSEDCAVTKDPKEMLKTAWSNKIPLIMGGSADEGLLWRFIGVPTVLKTKPIMLLPPEIRAGTSYNRDKLMEMAQRLWQVHVGDKKPIETCCQKTIDYYSIFIVWHGIHRSLLSRLANATAPTYVYHFAFDSATFAHLRRRYSGSDLTRGVAHGDEISYIWFGDYAGKLEPKTREYKMIKTMIGICTNFVKNSNPGIRSWQPLEASNPNLCYNIADEGKMMISPKTDLLLLWDSLYSADELF